jgi:predicted RNA-binding Zn ribbon-like protein
LTEDLVPSALAPCLYPNEPAWVRFVNTVWADKDGFHDALADAALARQWMNDALVDPSAHVDPSAQLGDRDLRPLRELRDALRRLAVDATQDQRAGASFSASSTRNALRVVARDIGPMLPRLESPGTGEIVLNWASQSSGVARRRWGLALEAAVALSAEHPLIRACPGNGCVLFYVKDHPRREWCSPACGNRTRVARHYRRQKSPS